MGNFIDVCRTIMGKERKSFTAVTLIAEMKPRSNDKGDFFAAEFSYEKMTDKDYDRNLAFYEANSEKCYDVRILMEYADKNIKPKDEWTKEEQKAIVQQAMDSFGYSRTLTEKASS